MIDNQEWIIIDYKDLKKELEHFEKEMPNSAKKLIQAVNTKAKQKIRQELRSRGYKATNQKSWGDAGYSKNLKSYADKNYGGKIVMGRNAFHYNFLEFGTHHNSIVYKMKGKLVVRDAYTVPADHVIYPAADTIWRTSQANQIMERKFQEIINKQFK